MNTFPLFHCTLHPDNIQSAQNREEEEKKRKKIREWNNKKKRNNCYTETLLFTFYRRKGGMSVLCSSLFSLYMLYCCLFIFFLFLCAVFAVRLFWIQDVKRDTIFFIFLFVYYLFAKVTHFFFCFLKCSNGKWH